MPYCEHCGTEGGGDYCSNCGQVRSFAAKATAASAPVAAQGLPVARPVPPPPWTEPVPTTRKVGIGLGIGIVFLPFVFAWFTLRRGHTGLAKGVAFGWLAIMVIANIGNKTSTTAATTPAPRLAAPPPMQAAVPAPAPEPAPLDVGAVGLWRAYHDNEVAADAQFKGKRLRVTGVVSSITKDFLDNIVVRLRSQNEFMNTMATMQSSESSKAASLSKGERLTVVCVGGGMVIGSPVLSDCVIR